MQARQAARQAAIQALEQAKQETEQAKAEHRQASQAAQQAVHEAEQAEIEHRQAVEEAEQAEIEHQQAEHEAKQAKIAYRKAKQEAKRARQAYKVAQKVHEAAKLKYQLASQADMAQQDAPTEHADQPVMPPPQRVQPGSRGAAPIAACRDLAGSQGVPAYEFVEPANRHDIILGDDVVQEIDERTAEIREQIARPDPAGSESDTGDEFYGSYYSSYNGDSSDIDGEFDQMIKCGVLNDWTAELTRLIAEMTQAADDQRKTIARQIRHARRCIIWANAGRQISPPKRRIPPIPFPKWATAEPATQNADKQ